MRSQTVELEHPQEGQFCDLPRNTFRPNLLCPHEGLLTCSAPVVKNFFFASRNMVLVVFS